MPARSDQQLLDALAAGDAAAFLELYERHGLAIHRIALRACGNVDDAADVTQEAFLHVLQRADRLRLTARLATYLYPVVVRLARRARERRDRGRSDAEVFLAAVAAWGATPLEVSLARPTAGAEHEHEHEPRAHLAHALAVLPAAQREALLLRYADGLSVDEAAAALGCPPGTVRSRVHHALQALRADPELRARLAL